MIWFLIVLTIIGAGLTFGFCWLNDHLEVIEDCEDYEDYIIFKDENL